jgi:SAM-dependent methyltransferase
LSTTESRYVEKKGRPPQLAHERELTFRETAGPLDTEFGSQADWLRCVQQDCPKFVPFLTRKCGLEFRGRILEIGAGVAWFSAELSKLPKVVEVCATDFFPSLLKEKAPKVFKLLKAQEAKITRMPLPSQRLDFPDQHFDFVVCAALLHRALNVVSVLREIRRVLKPGGQFVAVREPVLPLVKWKSAARRKAKPALPGRSYTLADYEEFFALAGLDLKVQRLNLSEGFKYYFEEVVNGFTHARHAFVGTKRCKS